MRTLVLGLLLLPQAAPSPARVEFGRDILPLLREHCISCHGEAKKKGGLRLDSREAALRGGVAGVPWTAGKADKSLLVERLVSVSEDERMPQKADPLPKEAVALFRAWIDQGAAWPDADAGSGSSAKHWAYLKPVRPALPAVKNPAWVRTPVDAFIAAGLEARGLRPRPEAAPHDLLRRVTLDLIGLPPTRAETAAFVADPSSYEKVVDRLLADPRHGERWARHWMDVWRYSDWAGYNAEIRDGQPHVWRWRDWIVESLNEDKGYDRMVAEMLAGDEIAPADPSVLRATGFLSRNWYKFNRNTWLQNVVEHVSKAFLATTINCARCHSHFFDPISQAEYYRFRAFFEPHQVRLDHVPGRFDRNADGLARAFDADPAVPTYLFARGDERSPDKSRVLEPGVPKALGGPPLRLERVKLPPEAVEPERRAFVDALALDAERGEAAKAREKAGGALDAVARLEKAVADAKTPEEAAKGGKALQAALEELPLLPAAAQAAEAKVAALEAVIRAENAVGDLEAARLAKEAQRALALADARVRVGAARRAAVQARLRADDKKPADEARKKLGEAEAALARAEEVAGGEPGLDYTRRPLPAYPAESSGRRSALARWIGDRENPIAARAAVNHVWLRHVGKALVGTVFDFGSHGARPSHPELLDWLAVEFMDSGWSFKRLHRLVVLSAAYRMDSRPDAAGLAADPDNALLWRMNPRRMEAEAVRDSVLYVAGDLDPARGGPELFHGDGLKVARRSLYFRHAAEKQMGFLMAFDAASPAECYQRAETVAPQQALALSNSTLALEKARRLAGALTKEAAEATAFIDAAFAAVLSRPATAAEREACGGFLDAQAKRLAGGDLTPFTGGQPVGVAPSADPAQRAREDLVHVLFNHHDFVTIR